MEISYNRLWKLMIDKGINKTQLCEKAKISTNAMAKMGKGGDVSTLVLTKICEALDCKLDDIVEIVVDREE